MEVKFKQLTVDNFKGIESLEIDFGESVTKIKGANETGKTTIADAIFYVLAGKNSLGESTFDITPTNKTGATSTVTLSLNVFDGEGEREIILCRQRKAKYTKEQEFTGDYSTVCYINGVKMNVKDYDEWIGDKICSPENLKFIFDTRYFTERISTTTKEKKWEVQRRILFNMCKVPTDLEIAKSDEKYAIIAKEIENNYYAHNALKAEKAKEKELQSTIERCNSQIESFQASIKNNDCDLSDIEEKINELEEQKNTYVESIVSAKKETSNTEKKLELQKRISEIQEEVNKEASKKRELIQQYEYQCEAIRNRKRELTEEETQFKIEAEKAVIRGKEINNLLAEIEKQGNLLECPTCHQFIPQDKIASQKEELQKEKKELAKTYKEAVKKATEINTMIVSIDKGREELKYPESSDRYNELMEEARKIRAEIDEMKDIVGKQNVERSEEAKEKIKNFENALLELQLEKNARIKITEAKSLLDSTVSARAEVREKIDNLTDFISRKCKIAEEKVNGFFDDIKFELFEKNKTNDEIKDVCNIYYKGVPFEALSYSTKFIVGTNIAYGFQKHLDIKFPVVVDNAESIDVGKPLETQAIYLTKVTECCPECGKETGRKGEDGLWTCNGCGHKFKKTIEMVSE